MYQLAQESFARLGISTEEALHTLGQTPISLHCWQGDDVGGFEGGGTPGGGLAVTGNYPGKARSLDELRMDLQEAYSLIPGSHRLNLHAIYGDFGGKPVGRDAIEPAHYESWIDWCRERGLGLDFNPSCFGHPMAASGLTLSNPDSGIRDYWIEHCRRCRRIADEFGKKLGSPAVNNIWIPDGMKDVTVHRLGFREQLSHSLDHIFEDPFDRRHLIDAVECKLFGIGSEHFVVGSHEFYLGYATRNQKTLCLDSGHFHPTEDIADKISSLLMFVPSLLLHVSRGLRWDSDHVVIFDDATQAMMREIVSCRALARTHIGLDFFDASINRIAAWAIGTRSVQKALLVALLLPWKQLREAELSGDFTIRLMLWEEAKTLPWAEVWEEYCRRNQVPLEGELPAAIKGYERRVLANRI